MTGIDSTLGSVLASHLDSLIGNVAAGARTAAAQTGASTQTGNAGAATASPVTAANAPPPPSAQAILSEVALTLDAISRFGGEATPAVLGELPIWPAPPAIDTAPASGAGLFTAGADAAANGAATATANAGSSGGAASANGATGNAAAGNGAVSGNAAASAGSAASVTTSAAVLPVAALAAALEQTVVETGLFYESHLAQWLAGTYPANALLNEPQTRVAAQATQLAFEWDNPAAGEGAPGTFFGGSAGLATFGSSSSGALFGAALTPHGAAAQLPAPPFAQDALVRQAPGQLPAGTAGAGANAGASPHAGGALPGAPSSVAGSIHPATIPLVRQQLDVLATQQFRWTGEVWPGTKLDWIIEPEPEPHSGAGGEGASDEQAWHTRLTLALPTLGTVDASLVLKGTQLVVRVQASAAGAARLSTGGEAFGRRLQSAGIELAGLSIREVGGAEPAAASGAAQAATSAYARTAAADEVAREVSATEGTATSDAAASASGATGRAAPSPLDHLFDDPFDWGGA